MESPDEPLAGRLGPYEVIEQLGSGGMGDVYRARDSRLGRDVAIKVLSTETSADPTLQKRLLREARMVSSLTHPNICALYDIGSDDGRDYLVMEYLQGETLAERLSRGALPIDEGIRYATEIAAALEAAHRKGVIHRDLKPANIMLTASGAKLLDFGLARLAHGNESSVLTRENHIAGTVAYMAPEQVNGEPADARTDIFAFGALLYEMLTGNRPFRGESPGSIVAAILFSEPEPIDADVALQRVISACLKKKPDDRIQTAHDLRLQLQWMADGSSPAAISVRRARPARKAVLWSAVAFVAGCLAVGLAWWLVPGHAHERQVRFTIASPVEGEQIDYPIVSPDGSKIAFFSENATGDRSLWVRDLSSTTARKLTDGGTLPFWSPDSGSVAFFSGTKLEVIKLNESKPQAIAAAENARGGSWSSSGTLIYAPEVGTAIRAIDANGSNARPVTRFDSAKGDLTHRWPEFLPDGEHFLFVIRSRELQRSGLYVGSLRDGAIKKVSMLQSRALATSDGWLLFVEDRKLWRQRFDLRSFAVRGAPIEVASGIEPDLRITGSTRISVSRDGTLVFGSPADHRVSMAWFSRDGKPLQTVAPAGYYIDPALSPDGTTVAVSRVDEQSGVNSIWMVDTRTGAMSAFVDDDANAVAPIWAADGRSLLYASDRRGSYEVYERSVGTAAGDRLILPSTTYAQPVAASATAMLLQRARPNAEPSDFLLWRTGAAAPQVLFTVRGGGADLSRDGRWVALHRIREESAREAIEVRSLADPSRRVIVGPEGSEQPAWRSDGRELYYADSSGRIYAQEFHDGILGPATPLFSVSLDASFTSRSYVPAADGQRFLVLHRANDHHTASATVVLHYDAPQ